MRHVVVVVAVMLAVGATRPAFADWMLIPFAGATVHSKTGFIDLDGVATHPHPVSGVAVIARPDRLVGLEVEATMTPSWFTGHELVRSSRVTTVSASAVFSVPVKWVRIRPYGAIGAGIVHVSSSDIRDLFPINATLPGLQAGGGVVIPVQRHVGVRADVRYSSTTHRSGREDVLGDSYLQAWRASLGAAWTF